jgi:hypothetical protein
MQCKATHRGIPFLAALPTMTAAGSAHFPATDNLAAWFKSQGAEFGDGETAEE